jgi:hypothetical protein
MLSPTNNLKRWFYLFAMTGLFFTACSKNDNPTPTPTPDPPVQTGSVPFYKLQRVENLYAPADDTNPAASLPPLYYSLENKGQITADFAKTASWDMVFTGTYNVFIGSNGATDHKTEGGILILKQPFEQVTDVPADNLFTTTKSFGLDEAGNFGQGTGWALYDFDGDKMGDGSAAKHHVVYALPATRTLVVRTAKGNYVKIKMISCYKDVFTADKWFIDTPHMYFTFEYVIVPKGSTKFEIK